MITHQDPFNLHSPEVHTSAQLPTDWASMPLQIPSYGASRTTPVSSPERSPTRHHPYLAPAPTYRGRMSRSLSSEPSLPALPYPAVLSTSHSMSDIEQQPTYLSVPSSNYPTTPETPTTPSITITPSTPRRIRIPQSFALGRSRRHPAYTVRFKVNGAAGFRIGDALANKDFAVDNPDDIVLETCVDRKGHLQVDVSAQPSSAHTSYSPSWTSASRPARVGAEHRAARQLSQPATGGCDRQDSQGVLPLHAPAVCGRGRPRRAARRRGMPSCCVCLPTRLAFGTSSKIRSSGCARYPM